MICNKYQGSEEFLVYRVYSVSFTWDETERCVTHVKLNWTSEKFSEFSDV